MTKKTESISTPKGNVHLKIKIDDLQTFDPLTNNQKKFFELYKRGDYFIALLGSPGVGKTFLALLKSLEEVLDKANSFEKVVIIRSAVQVRDQGFVPGTLEEKMAMYETPYIDICKTLFSRKDAWQRLCEQSHIDFISTTAIRGRTFDDAILIVDEAANLSWMELSAVMTRVGYRSKIIICGDLFQNDLIKNKNDTSGLSKFLDVARTMPEFSEINFTPDDIIRSSLTKNFIIACQNKGLIPSQ
jgi:phosphate starvation-inducible PhoH-like protein